MLKVKESAIYGQGCFALQPVARRKKIGEYGGELIKGKTRIRKRINEQTQRGVIKVIQIGEDLAIDAEVGGNETAYINHSCEPNAFMRAAPGNRVLFFALRDIASGEEITIDYRDEGHPAPAECCCGVSRCRAGTGRCKL
jgi:SET domain-containing protein